MFTTGSATSADTDKEPRPEVTEKSILDKAGECLWWVINYFQSEHHKAEARRFDPGPQHEPDFGERLRRIEGKLGRDYPEVRIDHYDEGGGKNSWKDYILGILALLIVAWLGRLSYQMDDLIRVVAKQDVDEKRIARLECTTYKICP